MASVDGGAVFELLTKPEQPASAALDKAISRSAYTWNVWIAIFCVKRTAFDIFLSPGSFVELPHAIPLRKVRVLRYWNSM